MKKILLLFISLFIVFTTIAQDRFQRIYSGTTITDAIKTDEGDYYLLESNNKILHVDGNGNLVSRKIIDVNASTISMTFDDDGALLDEDKNLVISYIDLERDSTKWFLGKFDFDGNKMWEISFPLLQDLITSGSELILRNYPIIKLDENHYLFCEIPNALFVNLYKIRTNGELIWQKRVNGFFFSGFTTAPNIDRLDDNNFILYNRFDIYSFNAEGDSLWHLQSPKYIRLNAMYSGVNKIIITDSHNITAIDTTGSVLWSHYIEDELINFNKLAADRYLLSVRNDTSNYLLIYDEFTDTFIRKDYNYKISDIKIYNENNVLSFGALSKELSYYYDSASCVFLKTDSNFNFDKEIYLVFPNGGEQFSFNSDYGGGSRRGIHWLSEDVENVNIYYTSDSGINWHSIVDDYSSTFKVFSWNPPVKYSPNAIIKIEDSDNSTIYDVSNSPIEIRYNNPYDYIAANEIIMWIGNNGSSAHNPISDDSGLYWPGGEDAVIPAVFADGILWGGKVNGMIHVNGSTFRYGLIPGAILSEGKRDDETKPEYSIYKLKNDWQNLPDGYEKELMQYSYDNWPAEHGAPFNDVNNDGIFTLGLDEPEIIGDETLFYVANDLDSARTASTYASPPIGLEFQQTLFAYDTPELKDVVFKRVKLINKSSSTINDMYVSYWNDDDLGNAGDDFYGCDTSLNLAFTWNGDNFDDDNYGEAPPAIGRVMLQGPITESKHDTAFVDGRKIIDFKNIIMSSFYARIKSSSVWGDPTMGRSDGRLEMYNSMQGLGLNRESVINPFTNDTTLFPFSGDPETDTGWYEGEGSKHPWRNLPGDRISMFSSGPFKMEPGDTQSVVYAIVIARGTSNVNSVTKLKEKARELHKWWGNDIPVSVKHDTEILPDSYSLSQNYPNPFNPTTTIKYTIPTSEFGFQTSELVSLRIYDILGREVATLVYERQKPGSYKVEWDATSVSRRIASGIYFYELRSNDFVKTNKMILLK